MKTTCHIATYRNLGRSKKKKINNKGHSSKNKNNPGELSIRRRAGRLRAPHCAARRGAERCGARGQGLLAGNARRLALEGGKRIKNGQDQHLVPRGFCGTSAAPPPLRPRPCLRAAAALRRSCAAESPAQERSESPLRRQVPAAARGRRRAPRPAESLQ